MWIAAGDAFWCAEGPGRCKSVRIAHMTDMMVEHVQPRGEPVCGARHADKTRAEYEDDAYSVPT